MRETTSIALAFLAGSSNSNQEWWPSPNRCQQGRQYEVTQTVPPNILVRASSQRLEGALVWTELLAKQEKVGGEGAAPHARHSTG